MTLAPRLFLSHLAIVAVALVAAAAALLGLLQQYETDVTRARAEELAAPFVNGVQRGLVTGVAPRTIVEQLAEQARAAGARLIIIDGQRRVVVDGEG
ncbi:MAG: hypothetical protein FJ104_06285, partial [Deltaproteobacteria bacterium]|nr:hypothetical protein [Deltaproteobacteria bacterium]